MIISGSNLISYILAEKDKKGGAIFPYTELASPFEAVEAVGRSRVFLINKKLVVKQPKNFDIEFVEAIRNEGLFYKFIDERADDAKKPWYKKLYSYMPGYLNYNSEYATLSIILLGNTISLRDKLSKVDSSTFASLSQSIGTLIGNVHQIKYGRFKKERRYLILRFEKPWLMNRVRTLDKPSLNIFGRFRSIFYEYFFKRENILNIFDRMWEEEWEYNGIIHGDIRLDNFLLSKNDSANVYLIDWEMVDVGDRAWDLASLWVEFLTEYYKGSLCEKYTFMFLQRSWDAYKATIKLRQKRKFILKVIRMAGIKYLQNFYEGVQQRLLEDENTDISKNYLDSIFERSFEMIENPQKMARQIAPSLFQ